MGKNKIMKIPRATVGCSSRRHKILIVVRWPGGGIRTFLRYVYRNFERGKFEITILGPECSEMDVLLEDLKDLDVKLVKVSEKPSLFEFYWAISRLVPKFNIVHSQGFISGMCAALPAFLSRCPHILTSHDVLSEKQFAGCSGFLKKVGMSIAFSLINTIHSVSYDAQQNLHDTFPSLQRSAGKSIVIRNGIEVERFLYAEPRDLRTELGVGDGVLLVGFLGRFMSQKGFSYLVDAIDDLIQKKNLSRQPLVVAFGDDGFVREERAQIEERGLSPHFRFLPFTPNVAGVIKGLDVVVMPSLWEACPLLAMEALVAGTPLIATTCIGLREVVRNTPTHTIPLRDSDALAEEIEFFMKEGSSEAFRIFKNKAAELFDVRNKALEIKHLVNERLAK